MVDTRRESVEIPPKQPNILRRIYQAISRMIRLLFIYPRDFSVYMVDAETREMKPLDFTALDKYEDSGRFTGPCVETIEIPHEDFVRLFKRNLFKLF